MRERGKGIEMATGWKIEEDREGRRVVYRIISEEGNVVIGTIDGYRGCLEGDLVRLSPEENKANAERIAALLGSAGRGLR